MSDDDRDNDIESDADKRAHHNALERKRRDHIKDSFSMLRDSLPFFQGDKASRAQILKKAADCISTMRKKNSAHQQDIADLQGRSRALEDQIRLLEKAKTPENLEKAAKAIENAQKTLTSMNYHPQEEYVETSDTEDSSENSRNSRDDSNDGPRKRLKLSPVS